MPKISLPLVGYFLRIFLSFPDIFINPDLSSNKGALLLQLIPIIGLILTDLLLYTICCENAALSGLNSLPHPLRISLECFFFKKRSFEKAYFSSLIENTIDSFQKLPAIILCPSLMRLSSPSKHIAGIWSIGCFCSEIYLTKILFCNKNLF